MTNIDEIWRIVLLNLEVIHHWWYLLDVTKDVIGFGNPTNDNCIFRNGLD